MTLSNECENSNSSHKSHKDKNEENSRSLSVSSLGLLTATLLAFQLPCPAPTLCLTDRLGFLGHWCWMAGGMEVGDHKDDDSCFLPCAHPTECHHHHLSQTCVSQSYENFRSDKMSMEFIQPTSRVGFFSGKLVVHYFIFMSLPCKCEPVK